MPQPPEEFYSSISEEFAEEYAMENMPQVYIDLLDRFIELVEGEKVLDAGCGPGRDTEYFVENGLDATGIDLGEDMIRHAEENKKGRFKLMDVKDLEFEDGEFDGVWSNTLVNLFPPEEMPDVVSELARVTRKNGVVYISFKIGKGSIMREAYGGEVKQYRVSEEKAREILESQGLEIVEMNVSETSGGFTSAGTFCRKK